MQCDRLLKNGKILTMDPQHPEANWMAIANGRIMALGTGVPTSFEAQDVVDLEGDTLLPGLCDSHVHGTKTGQVLTSINLEGADTIQAVLDCVRDFCVQRPGDHWIFGFQMNIPLIKEGRYPTRWELDQVTGDHPVYITVVSGHGAVVNSKALEQMNMPPLPGIQRNEAGEMLGSFVSDESTFYSGIFARNQLTDQQLKEIIQGCCDYCLSKGMTTLTNLNGTVGGTQNQDVYLWIQEEPNLPLHVVNFFQTMDVPLVKSLGLPRIGGCICLDGASHERTMALRAPYADDPSTCGCLYYTDEEVYQFMSQASRAGLQFAMHAIGDRAVDQYLRVYRRVYEEQGLQGNPLRNRIEHFSLVWPEQIDQAVEMGLVLSVQPPFSYRWDDPNTLQGGHFKKKLGQERTDRREPFQDILSRGGIMAGGSDSPVTMADPLLGIHCAVNMPNPSKRLPVTEAIKLYTLHGAYANGEESERGSLVAGKYADYIRLDRNPYEEPEEIQHFIVKETVVEGRTRYQFK